MYLTHLSLTNFRNFSRLDIEIPRRIIMLVGQNAQGKTSLLEAVYYFATFNSFLAQHDRELINFLALREPLPVSRMVIDFQRDQASHRLEVRLILEGEGRNGNSTGRLRREVIYDGVKRSLHEAMGSFNAVIFLPQMAQIIDGSPEHRRRYLNLSISQVVPGYSQDLSDYQQALTQRNALLKQLSERGGDPEQLSYWDRILCERGARIMVARISAVMELERIAARIHYQLTHSSEVLRLVYQPAYDPLPAPSGQFALPLQAPVDRSGLTAEQISQGLAQKLASIRQEEIARGVTTVGPHRDDLVFLSNGIDLGTYGSRGQIRSALLAVKLAEVQWMKERTGQMPVILLDEIMAELDQQRRSDLLKYLEDCEQVLMTTTDEAQYEEGFRKVSIHWRVQNGAIQVTPADE